MRLELGNSYRPLGYVYELSASQIDSWVVYAAFLRMAKARSLLYFSACCRHVKSFTSPMLVADFLEALDVFRIARREMSRRGLTLGRSSDATLLHELFLAFQNVVLELLLKLSLFLIKLVLLFLVLNLFVLKHRVVERSIDFLRRLVVFVKEYLHQLAELEDHDFAFQAVNFFAQLCVELRNVSIFQAFWIL